MGETETATRDVGRSFRSLLQGFEELAEAARIERGGTLSGPLPENFSEQLSALESQLDAAHFAGDLDVALRAAQKDLSEAHRTWERGGADPGLVFLNHRRSLGRALSTLYQHRAALPELLPYWGETGTSGHDPPAARGEPPAGLLRGERDDSGSGYALYVPEGYDPAERSPLVVCLHGGYGSGADILWTWLRPARSHGYLVLAPQSADVTWSILQPGRDATAVLRRLDWVCERYAVDPDRIYLTGLSDGGTYAYLLGLPHADRFAAIAPVAGDFHPMMDPMLRQGLGKTTPILIVHGAHDPIFPVRSIRAAHELMSHLDYAVEYRELPDWGHAYPYSINERIVRPWLAGH